MRKQWHLIKTTSAHSLINRVLWFQCFANGDVSEGKVNRKKNKQTEDEWKKNNNQNFTVAMKENDENKKKIDARKSSEPILLM